MVKISSPHNTASLAKLYHFDDSAGMFSNNNYDSSSGVSGLLPDLSKVGNDLTSGNIVGAITDTVNAITNAIKGRTYTKGKYTLGEKYMQHILNSDITSETKVPDAIVPQAIDYFSKMFGIPITTIEDLDTIDPLYTKGDNVTLYKTKRDPMYANLPDANVALAVKIKSFLPYNPWDTDWTPQHWDFQRAYEQAGLLDANGNPVGTGAAANLPVKSSAMTLILIIGGAIAAIIILVLIFRK